MKNHRWLYIPILFLFMLSFVDCAKRGNPNGGKRDSIPPVIVKSNPENFSINFDDNEISIHFDEFIKLKNLQQNLIISPPMKYQPVITPLSTSKILKIKILDTLKENTTYSFNFGKSIVDNNEDNEFEYFKYVFSTGTYIDSLQVKGAVTDALENKLGKNVNVVLYEVNEEYKDSIIFNEKPTYITAVNDSTSTYELSNLKEGKYLLLALQENNNNYIFDPSGDKLGYYSSFINLPTDSTYALKIFKELPEYEIARPKHEGKNHIIFGYSGNGDSLKLNPITTLPANFESRIFKDQEKDTLHYWFKPAIDLEKEDTLQFVATNRTTIDSLDVRLRDLFADSLRISNLSSSIMLARDTLKLTSNTPMVNANADKIRIMSTDSVFQTPMVGINETKNELNVVFELAENQNYTVEIFPEAITDFFEQTNDTLNYRVRTQEESDYGTITMNLLNVQEFPIIVQLVDNKYQVKAETYLTELSPVYFDYINPGNYYFRIIEDQNSNKIWDTGNFLKRRQPEKVIYYPTQIEVRANWSLNETFTLE